MLVLSTKHIYIFFIGESHGQREGTPQPLMCTIMNMKCNEDAVSDVAVMS